jgi:hypothetical protein
LFSWGLPSFALAGGEKASEVGLPAVKKQVSVPLKGEVPADKNTAEVFPVVLPGDDFDGTPCEIRFSKEWAEKYESAIVKMRPEGSTAQEKDTIRACVKLFYKKTSKGIEFTKFAPVRHKELHDLFSLEKDYEKSIYVGTNLYYTGKLSFADVKKYYHRNSLVAKNSQSLKSEENFNAKLKKHAKASQQGMLKILAVIRIDIKDKNCLIFVYSYPLPQNKVETFYLPGLCLWDGEKWVYDNVDDAVGGIFVTSLFANTIKETLQKNNDSIVFNFVTGQ